MEALICRYSAFCNSILYRFLKTQLKFIYCLFLKNKLLTPKYNLFKIQCPNIFLFPDFFHRVSMINNVITFQRFTEKSTTFLHFCNIYDSTKYQFMTPSSSSILFAGNHSQIVQKLMTWKGQSRFNAGYDRAKC